MRRATEEELIAYFSKFSLADLKTYAWTHMSSATRLTKKTDLVAAIVKFIMIKPRYLKTQERNGEDVGYKGAH